MNKYIGLLFFTAILTAFSQVLLKKAASKQYQSIIKQYLNIYVALGYFIFFIVLVINIFALKHVNMIIANAFNESIPYIITLIFSFIIFKEKITIRKILGSIIIICGVYLMVM